MLPYTFVPHGLEIRQQVSGKSESTLAMYLSSVGKSIGKVGERTYNSIQKLLPFFWFDQDLYFPVLIAKTPALNMGCRGQCLRL